MLLSALLVPTMAAAETSRLCDENVVPEPIALSYGDHTLDCALDEATDNDRFGFNGAVGDQIRVIVTGLTSAIDPWVQIFGPDGGLVAENHCVADRSGIHHTCSVATAATLDVNGLHSVSVRERGADGAGGYGLQLERVFPATTAATIRYDEAVAARVDPWGDHDFYRVPVAAGTRVEVRVTGKQSSVDPWFQVRDAASTLVVENHCVADRSGIHHNCSVASEVVVEAAGVWTFFVADAGADGVGDYEVSVNCIFGNCPNGPVIPPRPFAIEHPSDKTSGVQGVGGWRCGPHGVITAVFDDGQPVTLATFLRRSDTATVCGNAGLNGFFGIINYGLLGDGMHRVRFFEDGVQFAEQSFEVATLGDAYEPFAIGLSGVCIATNFPEPGRTTTARWDEGAQGFVLE